MTSVSGSGIMAVHPGAVAGALSGREQLSADGAGGQLRTRGCSLRCALAPSLGGVWKP